MSEDELPDLLEQVGERFDLGAYEIEAYLTVLERGSITASDLADETDIPQPRVYDTVRSLSERGLVELHESRPMTVVAIDPEEAFEGLATSFETMVEQLKGRFSAPGPEQHTVSLVKSRSTILRHLGRIIEAAEYELTLSLTPRLLSRFETQLRASRTNGVTTELLVTPIERAPSADRFPYLELATTVRGRRGVTTPVVAVADGERSMYATQDAVRSDRERYGVIFNQSELGFLLSGFFGTVLWSTAETIASDGPELQFPRRYASIRRCIKDLTDLEGTFRADVVGRRVDSGESCHLSGIIRDVEIKETEQIAAITVETDDGALRVGGRLAALEDVEAHEILIDRGEPPD